MPSTSLLGLPAYTGSGRIADNLYDAGCLTLSSLDPDAEGEQTLLIVGAAEQDIEGYGAVLTAAGFSRISENCGSGQRFACYGKGGALVYLSYYADTAQLLITRSVNRVCAPALSYPAETVGGGFEFYMYGLNMDPGGYNPRLPEWAEYNTSGFTNCGMLFAARLPDGALLLIDGGTESQHPSGSLATLNRFLHTVARKAVGEEIRIAAWFITHAHEDHYEGVTALLARYPSEYRLERVLASFPAPKPAVFPEKFRKTVETVRGFYPNCLDYKLHAGDRISLAGVTLSVLYTHENTLGEDGVSLVRDYNDTTTILSVEGDGMRVMLLGDISELAEERILASLDDAELRSDIVQVAHHNFNHVVRIYRHIAAPIACFTQTLEGTRKNEAVRANAAPVLETANQVYYSGNITKTVGFASRQGAVREIFRYNAFTE